MPKKRKTKGKTTTDHAKNKKTKSKTNTDHAKKQKTKSETTTNHAKNKKTKSKTNTDHAKKQKKNQNKDESKCSRRQAVPVSNKTSAVLLIGLKSNKSPVGERGENTQRGQYPSSFRGRRGRDRLVVGLTTTYAISTYHH